MVSIRSSSLAVATILLSASSALAAVNTVKPVLSSDKTLPASIPEQFGCYNSAQGMTWTGNYNYMTSSICQIYCINANKPVLGTSAGTDCWCGDYAPPHAAKVDSDQCSFNCTGFGQEMCGGYNTTSGGVVLSIWNDQMEPSISETSDSLTTSASTTGSKTASSTTPPVVTVTNAGGSVVTVVSSESSGAASSGGPSKAGIAAGVVVGVIAIAGIAGGLWFFLRQKRRREVEEEHKRQVAVNNFIAGGKPGSSGGNSIPDARLDPAVLRDRRMSDGSIMDNQDYSRRILKVTNA